MAEHAALLGAAAGCERASLLRAPVLERSAHSAARAPRLRSTASSMIHFVLLISRQGKVRLTKWYSPYSSKEKARTVREVSAVVLSRQQKQCNFLEYKDKKVIYKRYASLYFLACVDEDDNELIVLETIHHFVEVLDRYFGNVCELDLIFNFHKAYHILDELLISGELQEPSKKAILRVTAAQDALMEGSGDSKVSDSKYEI